MTVAWFSPDQIKKRLSDSVVTRTAMDYVYLREVTPAEQGPKTIGKHLRNLRKA